jgi:hypothetical protein
MMPKSSTIGQEIVAPFQSIVDRMSDRNGQALMKIKVDQVSDAVDAAIAESFQCGFEHAVKGGEEASRKMPQLKDSLPLVMYFRNAQDRQDFVDLCREAKPGMAEYKIPEST